MNIHKVAKQLFRPNGQLLLYVYLIYFDYSIAITRILCLLTIHVPTANL